MNKTNKYILQVTYFFIFMLQTPIVYSASPDRDNNLVYKVAIYNGSSWQYFSQNTKETPHKLSFPNEDVSVFIGVPKYPYNKWQVLFVRTSYMKNQPISLYRNSSMPWFNWFKPWRSSIPETQSNYIEFHTKNLRNLDLSAEKWGLQKEWHDTGLWLTNEQTYPFIKKIVASDKTQMPVSERLIRLKQNRPLMSWIKVDTHSPNTGEYLTIMMCYSGTLDSNPSVKLYKYYFLNSN